MKDYPCENCPADIDGVCDEHVECVMDVWEAAQKAEQEKGRRKGKKMNEEQFRLLMEGLDVLRRQLIDIEVAIIRKMESAQTKDSPPLCPQCGQCHKPDAPCRKSALYCGITGCNDEGKYMVCDNHFISAQRGRWV